MFRSIIFLSAVFALTSCAQKKQDQQNTDNSIVDSVAVINDPKPNLDIQTNSFFEIDSSGILLFPLTIGKSESVSGSLSYKEMPSNSYWNIIFLNSKTNEHHLLSDRKMLIGKYDFYYSSNNSMVIRQASRYIFYTIITDDFNNDKKLTTSDPKYLFVSDKEGNNFKQISPANYDLQNWQYIKSVNKLLMTVKKDSDKNTVFDDKDELTTFEIDIDKGSEPKEVFSTDFKNKLKILYNRDWKQPR